MALFENELIATATAQSDGRTYVNLEYKGAILTEYTRIEVYTPDGVKRFDKSGGKSQSLSFYIEDYPDWFITPLGKSGVNGKLNIKGYYEDYGLPELDSHDINLSYSIKQSYVTAPDLNMSLSISPQSNGYYFTDTTKVQATFSGSAKYAAEISSYNLHVDGRNYGSPYTSDTFKNGGWQTITGTVTDTRGFTASVSQRVWVMERMPSFDAINGNTYLNDSINYSYTPPNKDAYSRFTVACMVGGSYVEVENVNLGQSSGKKNGSFKLGQLGSFYNKYPNTTEVPLRFILRTYKDSYSSKLAEEYTKDMTLYIPENDDTKPAISSPNITPYPQKLGDSSLYIKSQNGAIVNSTWVGRYNANIESVTWATEKETFANGQASDFFTTYGEVPIHIQAIDTRGFKRTATYYINVRDYFLPYVSTMAGAERYIVRRSDENGLAKNDGTYLRVELGMRWTSLEGRNKCRLLIRKRPSGKDWEVNYKTLLGEDSSSTDYSGTLDENLDPAMIYTIELVAEDSLGNKDFYYVTIPTEKVYMERRGAQTSISFGGRVQKDNAFEVYQTAYFHNGVVMNFEGKGDLALKIREDGTVYADITQNTMEE